MKTNYRSRKIVLGTAKPPEEVRAEALPKMPPSRFILRAHRKEEEMPTKSIPQEEDNEDDSRLQVPPTSHKETQQEFDWHQSGESLQARDRRTLLKYDFREKRFQLGREGERVNEWLGEMHFRVVSASFKLYLSEELTFEEVKVHCCENLLLNVLNFLESLTENSGNSLYNSRAARQPLSYLEMTEVLKHVNEVLARNLAYMQIKYPLTKDSKPNKALQSLITKINNLGNDEHDLIMKSHVEFKYKPEGDYTAEVMRFINFLIAKQAELCGVRGNNKKELTYFEYFYETMERIFTSVYKPDFDLREGKDGKEKVEVEEDPSVIFANIISQGRIEEQAEGRSKEEKEYKEKVMKYTHYLIGQKISPNTELYSEKEVQTEIFDVKNSSILRILTKWTEELEKKILSAEEEILKRPFRFKRNKQAEFSKLNANQKNDLYQQARRRSKEVGAFNEELKENYNEIEAMLSSHLKQGPEHSNIPRNEYKVGFFCSKIQAAASSTLLSYLNKVIHILLLMPEELKKVHPHDEEYVENININLVTFKISDLFRCKVKSREGEIIRIFRELKLISERGEPFKIVRIKDRLSQGTRDIMVNILFKGVFLCEIQLAIEEYAETKQKSYDSFSHFLYEVHRSRLGPLMESACTWAQFDQRVKVFREMHSAREGRGAGEHGCEREFFVSNQYPFVCTLCGKFYATQEGLIAHKKCVLCKAYYECSLCIYRRMSEEEIARLLSLPATLGIFRQDFRLWSYEEGAEKHRKFPLFGLITSKKMKRPELVFFQTIVFKYDAYVIELRYNEQQEDRAELVVIEKIEGNSEKRIRQVAEKYIVYEWTEEKAINNRIMPSNMRKMLEDEKRMREQAAREKKQEKDKKKLELEKKRQEEEERLSKFLKRGEGEERRDKEREREERKERGEGKEGEREGEGEGKAARYNENIFKRNQFLEVRVIEKEVGSITETCVLGIFLKEYTIRNKLKKMSNHNILQKLSARKIEVLFMEDEFIHDEINDASAVSEIELQELRETFEGISEVYFDNNYIDDLSFLAAMNNLRVAHFSHNSLADLAPLQPLRQLTELVLENNRVEHIEGLRHKGELAELNLNRNRIAHLRYFEQVEEGELGRLRHLYLNDNLIESMEGIGKLAALVKLDLSFNKIERIPDLRTLLALEELDLSANEIKKMQHVANFSSLKKLYLNNNSIRVMSKELAALRQLATLNLSSNRIRKIQHLNTGNLAKTLRHLNLADNAIQKMEGLDTLESLEHLNLSNNEIQSINNYLDLASLASLNLSFNSIQELDLEEVEKDLPCLKDLNLSCNIVNNTPSNRSNLAYLNRLFGNICVAFKKQLD